MEITATAREEKRRKWKRYIRDLERRLIAEDSAGDEIVIPEQAALRHVPAIRDDVALGIKGAVREVRARFPLLQVVEIRRVVAAVYLYAVPDADIYSDEVYMGLMGARNG